MSRLCPTLVLGCGIALAGCSGQNLDGRWAGPWPYKDSTDCRTQLFPNQSFELVCHGDSWVGLGRYERDDIRLQFIFEALTHNGEVVKEPRPVNMILEKAAGNDISLRAVEYDVILNWNRRMAVRDIK